MPASSTLGIRITNARNACGFTIAEAAHRMAVTEKTVKKWEDGKSEPRANKLTLLAGVLGVPFLWLIDGDEQLNPIENRAGPLEKLEQKVERMNALQLELLKLSDEVANEIEVLREDDDGAGILAA